MGGAKEKIVMVFGVFDGLHAGHISFLEQARQYGAILLVVVARDAATRELKNRTPAQSVRARLARVREIQGVSKAVLGDHAQSSYGVLKRYPPDVICVGYDQEHLENDIRTRMASGVLPRIRLVKLAQRLAR